MFQPLKGGQWRSFADLALLTDVKSPVSAVSRRAGEEDSPTGCIWSPQPNGWLRSCLINYILGTSTQDQGVLQDGAGANET